MIHYYFGFHARYPGIRGIFGHVEAWGYDQDETWTFLDPQAAGFRVASFFKHDDVLDQLAARYSLCSSVLRIQAQPVKFAFPLHGMMTCASVCGSLVGIRALFPATLHRKLRAIGAEETKHDPQGRPGGCGSAPARAPDIEP